MLSVQIFDRKTKTKRVQYTYGEPPPTNVRGPPPAPSYPPPAAGETPLLVALNGVDFGPPPPLPAATYAYYIPPEIVGGTKGVFISNRIAYHILKSLNWGLAAALGTILLVAVLVLYWTYDKIVGIDNVKLGG